MIETLNLKQLCLQCIQISHQAATAMLEIYETEFDVDNKEDESPLTAADLAAHQIIIQGLSTLTPNIPVLSEEAEIPDFIERANWETYWLVDPLDGTREFVKRNGEFTVNIALIHNHKSVLGVIHIPVKNIVYFAWLNGGSYKQRPNQEAEKITVRKLPTNNNDAVTVVGSRSHSSKTTQQYINNIGNTNMLSMGSSLKFCLIAEGKADLYPRLGPTAEWDTAAASCIVEEAGGYITKFDNTPLQYNTKESLRNPFFLVYGDNSVDWTQYLEQSLTK